ncbi:MFS transporter [Stenotrophomonas maltophilia]|uniref:MFS transporter n=1 Tax=Stenotrophomonas maltophilia TaxID=40324 RepID=UPI001D0FA7E0|nr:MFS transporter [Stenotrophomonas maltophilia]UKJ27863.1 MFS transporter [Stenotrophomonas maltophilia]UXB18125.1 MFS transporter [Stenotrophomonas maltophilia]WDW06420.1 MFS transporter [Stenotrophomonas maltophilia]
MKTRADRAAAGTGLLLLGLILVGASLRSPITGVGPVLQTLRSTFDLTSTQAGLLTTLPLIAFGVLSPFAGRIANRFGLDRVLLVAMLVLLGGVALRSAGTAVALYLGTAAIGFGIAFGNVLMPAIVKKEFPGKVPSITSKCGMAMGLGAAAASASAVPLEHASGWQVALGATAVFPALALLIWLFQLKPKAVVSASSAAPVAKVNVWGSALAWQVSIYMAINSILFYAMITWLPSILTDNGLSDSAAGSLHGLLQLASIVPGLLLGAVVSKLSNQRGIAVFHGAIQIVALAGLIFMPAWAPVWSFLFGMGTGGALLLSLMFMGLRTSSPQQAASLSGMAQCVNFLLAACGPAAAGWLHTSTGGWNTVLAVGIALAAVMGVFGALAGRTRTVG